MTTTHDFIPAVGDLFFVEPRPQVIDVQEIYDHRTGKLHALRKLRYDYTHRMVIYRCTSKDLYVLIGTSDSAQTNRHMFVIGDNRFMPISPSIMADLGMGMDGYPLRVDSPDTESVRSNDREITEGLTNG